MADQIASLLLGAALALVGGVVSKWVQEHITDKREQLKLRALICGELINIARHCDAVDREIRNVKIGNASYNSLIYWKKRKHGELAFIKAQIAKLGFLDPETVGEFLQLFLYIRNNDIEIDGIIEQFTDCGEAPNISDDILQRMIRRIGNARLLAKKLLEKPAVFYQKQAKTVPDIRRFFSTKPDRD